MCRKIFLTLCLSLALVSCGGGSGGPASLPVAAPKFSGSLSPVSLDTDEKARLYSTEPYSATVLIRFLYQLLFEYQLTTLETTIQGPDGGSVRVSASSTQIWLNFSNYTDQGIVLNGSYVQKTVDASGNSLLEFSSFKISDGQVNLVIDGDIFATRNQGPSLVYTKLVANLSLADQTTGEAALLQDFEIVPTYVREGLDTWYATDVNGRYYFDEFGYIDVTTSNPLRFKSFQALAPYFGGPMVMSDGSSTLALEILNQFHASTVWDIDNDGAFDVAARSVGVNGLEPEAVPPIANISRDPNKSIGTTVYLDGLGSRGAADELLSFEWSLIGAPIGSKSELAQDVGPYNEFTPDREGQYLVQLRVLGSEGEAYSSTVINVIADFSSYGETIFDATLYRDVGDEVVLDGGSRRAPPNNEITMDQNSWEIDAPSGSGSMLSAITETASSFMPDVQGFYGVHFGLSIPVGVDFDFHSFYRLVPWELHNGKVVTGDFNSDGLVDFAQMLGGDNDDDWAERNLLIYLAWAPGRFEDPIGPVTVHSGTLSFAVGDLNNDGIDEIVTSYPGGIRVLSVDGTPPVINEMFIPVDTSVYGDTCPFTNAYYSISDVDSDGLNDLNVYDGCADRIMTYLQSQSGGMTGPIIDDAPGLTFGDNWSAEGDLNGDGLLDFAYTYAGDGVVLLRNSDHTFTTERVFDYGNSNSGHAVGIFDIDADGFDDILIASGSSYQVVPQLPNGQLGALYQYQMPWGASTLYERFVSGDLNNDGLEDIVLEGRFTHTDYVYAIRMSDGTFEFYPAVGTPGLGSLVDINNDGVMDLVSTSPAIALGKPVPNP